MSSLAIIIIVVLSATLIYVWAKCQSLQKEVHSKENKENELKKLALVLQNINAYFLLIDKDFVVCDTNYYSLNRLPVQVGGFFIVSASSAWVPALSQMKVGLQPRRATSAMRGAGSGPKSSWAKVRCIFSPPLGVN